MLYLMQRGEAEWEERDPNRPLTEKGRRDVERVSASISRQGVEVNRILHSGKKRAVQTADILGQHVRPSGGIHRIDGLKPLDDPEDIASQLVSYTYHTALVGHLPHLEKLAGLLLCGDGSKKPVGFRNAGIVALESEDHKEWSLAWIITPVTVPRRLAHHRTPEPGGNCI